MNFFMTIITSLFDMFIIISYMSGIFKNKKNNIPISIYYGCFIAMEIAISLTGSITANMSSNTSLIINSLVSLTTTFLLTFLYEAPLLHKIFTSLSFQIFVFFGEYIFTFIIQLVRPEIFESDKESIFLFMNLGSKIFLYLLCLLCVMIWKAKFSRKKIGYNLLLFTTPFISLFIMIFIPLDVIVFYKYNFTALIFSALALLNVTNYILLNISFNRAETNYRLNQMEQQIKFQNEKYLQLSTAYKTNRSVIHDVKKHYFTIQEYMKNNEYGKLEEYLKLSINDIENTYADINTGNLVIDSFVSNYKKVSNQHSIQFIETITVDPNRIPVNDYDLCIILGNLLDNSLNACMNNAKSHNKINLEISVNSNDTFLIYIANTYDPKNNTTSNSSSLEHGYGLENIKQIVEKHHGMFRINKEDSDEGLFELTIIIPIINIKQRLHTPSQENHSK